MTGAHLATGSELTVDGDFLYFIDYSGRKERVGAVYRRISDEYLDPMNFLRESVIGISHIYDVYRKGNVALLNAPGNGAADDKGLYYFVPRMISYYLGEEPILQNAPTYLPFYKKDMRYILENFDSLVIKDVAKANAFGNRCIYGYAEGAHDHFSFSVSGTEYNGLQPYENAPSEVGAGMFKYQTAITQPGEALRSFSAQQKRLPNEGGLAFAVRLMHTLYGCMRYTPPA